MSDCGDIGQKQGIWTGNQVGWLNFTGDYNFVSGGGPENGITAGTLVVVYIPPEGGVRRPYRLGGAELTQELINASYPEMEFKFIVDITLKDGTLFRVSNRNTYVQDADGKPRFYEARARAPRGVIKTLGEWLKGDFEIGEVTLEISNSDGFFDNYLANGDDYQNWTDTEVLIKVGFGEEYKNYFNLYKGFIPFEKGLEVRDDIIVLRAREQFEKDQIEIPRRTYNKESFPFINKKQSGGKIPLIYGDWTVELGENSLPQIEATCINGDQVDPTQSIFKICDNSLKEITEITIERGSQGEDKPTTPPRFDLNELEISLEDGIFAVDTGRVVLLDELMVIENGSAQAGTTTNKVNSTQKSFIDSGVQVGDVCINLRTGDRGTVLQVQDTSIDLELEGGGNINFEENDEFRIKSKQYKFVQGDSIRLKCKGKDISLVNYERLKSVNEDIDEPSALTVDNNGFYYVADNLLQKIFKIKFKTRTVELEINYNQIAPGLTDCTGLAITPDHDLIWVISRSEGYIYQYSIGEETTEVSIDTDIVVGLPNRLDNMYGLGLDVTLGRLWVADENEQTIYEINPFPATNPTLISSFPYSNISASTNTIPGLSYDVFQDKLLIIDSNQEEVHQTSLTGSIEKTFSYLDIYKDVTDLKGASIGQDGSWFFVDRITDVFYNFLPYDDIDDNVGFQARDLITSFAGKTFNDFSITWNNRAQEDLSQFKSRFVIDDDSLLIEFTADLLEQFNTEMFIDATKYNIFYNHFDNYEEDGFLIAERDIMVGTFSPKQELRQYFNSADSLYRKLPASDKSIRSETLVSNDGIQFAGKEKKKSFNNHWVYREQDINNIIGTRINQSVPQPEIISVELGFRTILLELTDFVKIMFADEQGGYCAWKSTESSRRFQNIPAYIREISYDLNTMSMDCKIWSLGTTRFGDFIPAGNPPGGENGNLSVVASGNKAFISPTGIITNIPALNQITIRDENGQNAENRSDPDVGNAWTNGYLIALVDASTHQIVEINEIDDVIGDTITFVNNWTTSFSTTDLDSWDVIIGGYYLTYADYDTITEQANEITNNLMKNKYAFYTRTKDNAALTINTITAEGAAGVYNFDDGRSPYIFSK